MWLFENLFKNSVSVECVKVLMIKYNNFDIVLNIVINLLF